MASKKQYKINHATHTPPSHFLISSQKYKIIIIMIDSQSQFWERASIVFRSVSSSSLMDMLIVSSFCVYSLCVYFFEYDVNGLLVNFYRQRTFKQTVNNKKLIEYSIMMAQQLHFNLFLFGCVPSLALFYMYSEKNHYIYEFEAETI
jgi:hypothetical protein